MRQISRCVGGRGKKVVKATRREIRKPCRLAQFVLSGVHGVIVQLSMSFATITLIACPLV